MLLRACIVCPHPTESCSVRPYGYLHCDIRSDRRPLEIPPLLHLIIRTKNTRFVSRASQTCPPEKQSSHPFIMASSNPAVDTSSTEGGAWRREIDAALYSVRNLISKSLSPIAPYPYVPNNDPDQKQMTSLLTDLRKIGFKDVEALLALFNSQVKGSQDDNKLILEHLVQILSKLGDNSKIAEQLTNGFIDGLWNALPHPPLTSLGSEYKYREADGSKNNILNPTIGAANTPYTRYAKPVVLQNVALPDPGTIFDSLMARNNTFEPHPNKISSMLFYQATIIIHDIFRTVSSTLHECSTSAELTDARATRTSIFPKPAPT